MNQPELGKKIAELRKAKGFTQEELVERCNLSVRTLQRIESGEVIPRSYTIKSLFAALDYNFYDSSAQQSAGLEARNAIITWLEQFYQYVLDLLNFKKNTMKKITILSVTIFTVLAALFILTGESRAQSNARTAIAEANKNYIRWSNWGPVDSLMTLYTKDACLLLVGGPNLCGKDDIADYWRSEIPKGNTLVEVNSETLNISGDIAIEKGSWLVKTSGGYFLKGKFLTEWHRVNGKWLMQNDMGAPE